MKKVAISGYFDPIHVGHLEYIELSKKLGDYLIVIVNNNHQCVLKKGKPFMDEKDRIKIIEAIEWVDEVFLSIDMDKTVCKSLEAIKPNLVKSRSDQHLKIINNTSDHINRLNIKFNRESATQFLLSTRFLFQNLDRVQLYDLNSNLLADTDTLDLDKDIIVTSQDVQETSID